MDHECEVVARNNVLEDMLLHDSAAPTCLPFSLLKDITNDFSDDQLIGRGGFATVYKGRLWSGSVAVKKLHSNIVHIDEGKFMNEVECLMKVRHENIVRFLGYCSEGHGRISEYQDASSGHIEWIERCQIIKGICLGLYYLHKMSILHMDLKPANILLDYNMVPKIADFGLARWFGENQIPAITKNIVGTRGYMAPEYRSTGVMTDKSDIYSLGVIIMEILTGKKEHCEENHGHVACACVLDSWKSRLEPSSADTALAQIEACAAISMDCMDPEPENRPVIQDVLDKLNKIKLTSDGFSENTERSMLVAQVSWRMGMTHHHDLTWRGEKGGKRSKRPSRQSLAQSGRNALYWQPPLSHSHACMLQVDCAAH
ncbi:unnamed protein product [Urochloa decumbens]|uniref:non-specific serine/threonine protein kinase n=1 Tax=Urochloa decumbens TaxID=240449 RepID=A0ABC9ATX2_9POAL